MAPLSASADNRMLRVVYYDTGAVIRVITLFSIAARRGGAEGHVTVDEEADALYIRFDDATIIESEEVSPGIVLDFDADGRVVGFEMLSVRKRFPNADLSQMEVAQL